ncbi:hypothetical protein K438DRAFT_1945412 [Mycena galopus ATCC 62051]|nr:hypothetical protein K438DRAFT_1945412 [Mycena galopus ATCC 62051]
MIPTRVLGCNRHGPHGVVLESPAIFSSLDVARSHLRRKAGSASSPPARPCRSRHVATTPPPCRFLYLGVPARPYGPLNTYSQIRIGFSRVQQYLIAGAIKPLETLSPVSSFPYPMPPTLALQLREKVRYWFCCPTERPTVPMRLGAMLTVIRGEMGKPIQEEEQVRVGLRCRELCEETDGPKKQGEEVRAEVAGDVPTRVWRSARLDELGVGMEEEMRSA